jgi:hypothetical protein
VLAAGEHEFRSERTLALVHQPTSPRPDLTRTWN